MANDPREFKIRQAVNNHNRAEVRTIEVMLKAIRTQQRREIADRRNLFAIAEQDVQRMEIELATYIAGNEYETQTRHWVPKTWWDHFKKRWFPDWLKKYFPVETKSLKKTRKVTIMFPDLDIPEKVWDTLQGFEKGIRV